MQMNAICEACFLKKYGKKYPAGTSEARIQAWETQLQDLVVRYRQSNAPEALEAVEQLHARHFGPPMDYSQINHHFNALMLSIAPQLLEAALAAEDPLKRAIQYGMVANFIDFGAVDQVNEEKLQEFLAAAEHETVDEAILAELKAQLSTARRLVLLADNCGEIVADKVLLTLLRRFYPNLHITVIVRGGPVLNDATLADARQIALAEVAHQVLDSGAAIAGTVLHRVSPAARAAIDAADLLFSKGQGNYEGLSGCGLNIFYSFLCKCEMFAQRFGVRQFCGILTHEAVDAKKRSS